MLYAKISSILSFEYYLYKNIGKLYYNIIYIVIKLKQWRQSAGNYIKYPAEGGHYIFSSETIRNNNRLYLYNPAKGGHNNINNINNIQPNAGYNTLRYYYKYDNMFKSIKPISVHRPKHLKPLNDQQFGYYLAGYIDAKGYFNIVNNRPQLILIFDIKDYSLAYFIKGYLGYGSVKNLYINDYKYIYNNESDHPAKGGHNSIKLLITSKKGLNKVINLINNKILNINVYNQITKPDINGYNFIYYINNTEDSINKYDHISEFNMAAVVGNKSIKYPAKGGHNYDFNNHWLAGFIDGNGEFLINLIKIYLPAEGSHKYDNPAVGGHTTKNNNLYKNYILPNDIDKLISNNKLDNNYLNDSKYNDYIIDVKLCLKIKSINIEHKDLLTIINNNFGGYIINYNNNDNIYTTQEEYNQLDQYLYIDNFKLIRNIILYLDKYHLLSHKFVNYIKWRKIYTILQDNRHLTKNGFNKIIKFK